MKEVIWSCGELWITVCSLLRLLLLRCCWRRRGRKKSTLPNISCNLPGNKSTRVFGGGVLHSVLPRCRMDGFHRRPDLGGPRKGKKTQQNVLPCARSVKGLVAQCFVHSPPHQPVRRRILGWLLTAAADRRSVRTSFPFNTTNNFLKRVLGVFSRQRPPFIVSRGPCRATFGPLMLQVLPSAVPPSLKMFEVALFDPARWRHSVVDRTAVWCFLPSPPTTSLLSRPITAEHKRTSRPIAVEQVEPRAETQHLQPCAASLLGCSALFHSSARKNRTIESPDTI